MTAQRPFGSVDELMQAADATWRSLDRSDWLEAFSHHPRIGGDDVGRQRFAATRAWSRSEQAGVEGADDALRQRLASGNDEYVQRFGFVFLICAAGRSAAEMAQALERRLGNDPETELHEAAEQQRLITRLRLAKLLGA